MKNFKDSLQAGIDAAKVASNNRQEIASVIRSVNEQVKEISDGKAMFSKGKFYREPKPEALAVKAFISIMGNAGESYQGLGIYNGDGKNGIIIAEWSEGASGYPCSLSYAGEKIFCSNKIELENALSDLLSQVETGEAILKQMKTFVPSDKPKDPDSA